MNGHLALWAATLALGLTGMTPLAADQAPTTQPAETAAAFYVRYRGVVEKAKNADDVTAFWSAEQAKQYASAPESERMSLVEIKRLYAARTAVRVVSETWTSPTSLTLRLEGLDANKRQVAGSVVLIIERGTLKVAGPEIWQ